MKVRAGDRGMIPFAAVFIVLIGLAILAPIVAPYSPDDQDLVKRFMPPLTPGHTLGTDHLGRDILTRLIFGTRISLSVGSIAVFISVLFGTVLGILSGYYGGMFDDIVNWFVNVQLAFPFILLAISVIAVLGPSLVNMIIVLAIGGWPAYVRVVRSKVFRPERGGICRGCQGDWSRRCAHHAQTHLPQCCRAPDRPHLL